MEHLIVNHQDMVSAEVEMVITGKRLGMYRVIMRDLDADAVVAIRFFPRHRRADAIAFADDIVNIVA
jgi:hypothetical protein